MRQIFIIPLVCYLALLLEFCLFNLLGRWGAVHVGLLVVIFFNLYSGIRFSLWAALWVGVFYDCFSTMPFGTYIFVYIVSAYSSTFIRRYAYERGSDFSKWLMVAMVVTVFTLVMGLLRQMVYETIAWQDVWMSVWLPELCATLVMTLFVFGKLRDLARVLRF
jgi:rod shape-determining protein MreD